ncbi:MAG: Rv1355c family protein, partial [Candidatus Magasanikbacteria bacterium]|nr:Rv1355c family protein [Candidatus Magasanikbacteria bacterium]
MSDVSLQDFLTGGARLRAGLAPRLFHLNRPEHREALAALVKENAMSFVVDDYEEQLREYYGVLHPADIFKPSFASEAREYIETLKKNGVLHEHGVWVYYPWNATLVHILDDKEFQMVRTARNKLLITSEEQAMYYNAVVGIAGLSVGNSCALAIALQGGARRLRLADFDLLALSNLNRIRAGVDALGLNKVVMTMRQIYLLNPYAEIEAFPDGLNEGNIDRFFESPPKLDIVVDEIDNLAIKFLIRERAQKLRLPVVMAADNGDDGVVDVERYDLDQNTPFFHGRMGN